MPAGAFLGHAMGWRVAFLTAAGLSVAVLAAQVLLLPRLPISESAEPRELPAVLAIPQVRIGLICVIFLILGHFMAYTYITPFLEQRAGTPPALISLVLLAYGVAGFVGNIVAGALLERDVRTVVAVFSMLLGLALIALPFAEREGIAIAVLIVFWGFAFGGIPISLQTWMFRAAPESMSSVSAVFVSIFQLSSAAGALLGGVSVAGFGLSTTMALGGAIAGAAGLVILGFGRIPLNEPADILIAGSRIESSST